MPKHLIPCEVTRAADLIEAKASFMVGQGSLASFFRIANSVVRTEGFLESMVSSDGIELSFQ